MRGLGQIAYLASFARPDVGVITNVGPVHLELVETVENVAKAKAELIDALPAGGIASSPTSRCSSPISQRSDIDISSASTRTRRCRSRRAYSSRHQLANTRFAVAVAEALDMPLPRASCTSSSRSCARRSAPLPGDGLLLNDCYNANPVSMRAALEHLPSARTGRAASRCSARWPSSAPRRRAYHDEIGALARELGIEHVIAVGELARAYGGDWVPTATDAAAPPPRRCGRATSCSSRARARWDSSSWRRT